MLEALPHVIAKRGVFEMDGIGVERKSSEDRVLDSDGLLIDFFKHEMLVAALFGHYRIPRDLLELRLAAPARSV